MAIAYGAPLERGFIRMRKALFSPFDLGKWFTIGFTAFLAEIVNSRNGGGGGGGDSPIHGRSHWDWGDLASIPGVALDWIRDHPGWFLLGGLALVAILAVVVALTWVSSRGKFMFLYNVARDESKVARPWKDYRQEGNSLFLWRLVFGLICLVPILLLFGSVLHLVVTLDHGGHPTGVGVLGIIAAILAGVSLFAVIGFIDLMLDSFVVPIMYKHRLGAVPAWKRFLSLFFRHPWHFVLYGLMVLVLHILVTAVVFVLGLLTCCIGFLLLILPYIGSVLMLPVSYTLRAFSIEYLGQFGTEYDVFGAPPEPGEAGGSR